MTLDYSLRRLGLTKNSKVCSITHAFCCDGSTSQLLLQQTFRNITCISSKYDDNRDSLIKSEIESNKYDFIFLTDISPIDPEILKDQNRVILLDHHASALYLHCPQENKYVIPDRFCGASLTKRFIEEYFGLPLKHMTRMVSYVQDYDLWTKRFPQSTFLNELHFFYYSEGFKKRFYSGDTRFTKQEIDYLRKRKNDFKKVFDELEVYELNKINGCFIQAISFVNELAEKLYTGKYDIVFIRNPEKNSVSVRCKNGFIDVLKEYGGGGHGSSGAILIKGNLNDVFEKIKLIEERIYLEIKNKKTNNKI